MDGPGAGSRGGEFKVSEIDELKSVIEVCMFDQYGTVVDMQSGLTRAAATNPHLRDTEAIELHDLRKLRRFGAGGLRPLARFSRFSERTARLLLSQCGGPVDDDCDGTGWRVAGFGID
jgi:hypothetical protein